jgi:hypothetical protein
MRYHQRSRNKSLSSRLWQPGERPDCSNPRSSERWFTNCTETSSQHDTVPDVTAHHNHRYLQSQRLECRANFLASLPSSSMIRSHNGGKNIATCIIQKSLLCSTSNLQTRRTTRTVSLGLCPVLERSSKNRSDEVPLSVFTSGAAIAFESRPSPTRLRSSQPCILRRQRGLPRGSST